MNARPVRMKSFSEFLARYGDDPQGYDSATFVYADGAEDVTGASIVVGSPWSTPQ